MESGEVPRIYSVNGRSDDFRDKCLMLLSRTDTARLHFVTTHGYVEIQGDHSKDGYQVGTGLSRLIRRGE